MKERRARETSEEYRHMPLKAQWTIWRNTEYPHHTFNSLLTSVLRSDRTLKTLIWQYALWQWTSSLSVPTRNVSTMSWRGTPRSPPSGADQTRSPCTHCRIRNPPSPSHQQLRLRRDSHLSSWMSGNNDREA